MKILLMTDMEGVAGVLDHDNWVLPDARFYAKGLRLLAGEVNAAIDGLVAGGAREVIVYDGHGAGGIDPELLDERAQLVRGVHEQVYPWGLDNTFAGLAFVGQHAKAGTSYSHITHTGWFGTIDYTVNGISVGEYGQIALCAMELGIPTILACGEEAFAREAEALTPGVVTVGVKRGLLPDGLEALDTDTYGKAKLSALHLSPAEARRRIRDSARQAIDRLRNDPGAFRYPKLSPPYVRVIKLRRHGEQPARELRSEHPSSIITLLNMPEEPPAVI